MLFIPAAAGILSSDPVDANKAVAYKEALFYVLAVSVTAFTIGLAVIYAPSGTPFEGTITPLITIIPLGTYALYIFTQYQDAQDSIKPQFNARTDISVPKQLAILVASLIAIAIAVEGLVNAALTYGDILGTPPFFWGLTVIAVSTSLPDTLLSISKAKQGEGVTSLANVFGSNTFNLLVAVPVGVIAASGVLVSLTLTLPLFAFLTFSTVLLFTIVRTDFTITTTEAYVLMTSYALFLLWMLLEAIGILSLLPT